MSWWHDFVLHGTTWWNDFVNMELVERMSGTSLSWNEMDYIQSCPWHFTLSETSAGSVPILAVIDP
jgi:hypothetical protein